MLGLWKILYQEKFDSKKWKNFKSYRRYFYKDIIKTCFMGRSKQEIEKLFGIDESYDTGEKWKYFLHKNKGSKKNYYLIFYFEDDNVVKTKIVFRIRKDIN